ncbi:hypothetical protein RQP46_007766 [Phenoliferia psychrophenolica]
MASDDEFGDDDLDWDDATVLAGFDAVEQRATQHPAPPPPVRAPVRVPPPPPTLPTKRPLAPPVRHAQPILRPPQPPPAKRQRVNNPVVHPNPFHQPAPSLAAQDDEDEEMPEISVSEGGYGVRASGTVKPSPRAAGAGPGTSHAALESWGEPKKPPPKPQPARPPQPQAVAKPAPPHRPPVVPPAPARPMPAVRPPESAVASGSGMSEVDRRELETLREERTKLLETVKESEDKRKKAETDLMGKIGEVSIIRNKLTKSAKTHQTLMEDERKVQRDLEERLELKEKELKREMDKFAVESAFRRQETETSAKRAGPSQWSSTNRARANSVQPGGLMGPPPIPSAYHASPSVGRARANNASSQRPPVSTQGAALLGFQNSFDSPAGGAVSRRSARAETMPPPASAGRGRGLTTPERKPISAAKGKGKMMIGETVEEEGDESIVVDSKGVSEWGAKASGAGALDDSSRIEDETEEEDDEEEWMDFSRDRMIGGGSVVAALFCHRTFVHFEPDSVNLPPSTSQRSSTFSLSFARTGGSTARLGSLAQSSGRLDLPPAPTVPQAAVPTFHSLMSLRLPVGTPLATVTEYEDVCRDLSATLGQRPSLVNASANLFSIEIDTTSHLARGVGSSLEALARILDEAGVIGPLISLLSLLSSLILHFPPFALHFLNVPLSPAQILPPQGKRKSNLLALLARVVKRFGRPAPVARVGEKAARGGRTRERPRRVRAVGNKPLGAVEKASEERIELEPAKRIALLSAVVEVLEGLAWRMTERAKESFVDFLAADAAVATLLDSLQPVALITSTTRFLSSLACQPSLFRPIVGIQFYEANDVRGSKFPLFDRLASLLVRNTKATHVQMFTLDMCLVSLATSLLTKNSDALIYVSQNASFIPELLDKLFKDTRLVWEYDGQAVSDGNMTLLKLVVARLSALVHLFYYIACSPKSTINLTEYFTQSTYLGLHARFNIAFGTLSVASLPDWAVGTPDGVRLTELGYLAQEIMEDVSPQEADEIESCFVDGPAGGGMDDDMLDEEEDIGLSQGA